MRHILNPPLLITLHVVLHSFSAIANETGYIIYTTKIRVFQDEEAGIVDTTKLVYKIP